MESSRGGICPQWNFLPFYFHLQSSGNCFCISNFVKKKRHCVCFHSNYKYTKIVFGYFALFELILFIFKITEMICLYDYDLKGVGG